MQSGCSAEQNDFTLKFEWNFLGACRIVEMLEAASAKAIAEAWRALPLKARWHSSPLAALQQRTPNYDQIVGSH